MINVGMDVHNDSTVIDFFDPGAEPKAQHRTVTVRSTGEAITAALRPLQGRCRVAFEVGTQAQWVAEVVRPPAAPASTNRSLVIDRHRIPPLTRERS